MIKNLITYFVVFTIIHIIGVYIHQQVIINKAIILPFSLEKVYTFHAFFSGILCVNFMLLASVNKFKEQLGFIYLASLVLKIILFSIIFYQPIFKEENLSQTARVSLFIPTIIFLLTEAVFITKILNKKR